MTRCTPPADEPSRRRLTSRRPPARSAARQNPPPSEPLPTVEPMGSSLMRRMEGSSNGEDALQRADERATTMIRMTMSTSRPSTTTTVTTSDWKDGLPVIAGSTFTLRELRVEDAPVAAGDADHRRGVAVHFAAADHGRRLRALHHVGAARAPGRQLRLLRGRAAGLHHRGRHLPAAVARAGLRAPPNGASRSARSSGARASSPRAPASSSTSPWT